MPPKFEEMPPMPVKKKQDAEPRPSRVAKSVDELKTWGDYAAEPLPVTPWIIKGFLVRGKITVIYGPGGIGKSFLAAHAAMCVTKGLPFAGNMEWMCCEPGPVLWLDNENDEEENRVRGVKLDKQKHKQAPYLHPIVMHDIPKHGFKATEEDCKAVAKLIDELEPVAVFMDSLVTALADDMEENDSGDMNLFFDRIYEMITHRADGTLRTKMPALLTVHHASKFEKDDGWSQFRGSSRIKDAAVFFLGMKRGKRMEKGIEKDTVHFRFEKSRRGPTPPGIYEYAIEDRWEGIEDHTQTAELLLTDDPRHWIEFVPYGRVQEDKNEEVKMKPMDAVTTLMTKMEDGTLYMAKELAEMLGVKDPRHTAFRNLLKKLVKDGILEMEEGPNERILYRKSDKMVV